VEFVSKLFSRPLPATVTASSTPAQLFAAVAAVAPSDSAYEANRKAVVDRLRVNHHFVLSDEDYRSINHVYGTFFEAGPDINYGFRPGAPSPFGSPYPNFGQLQTMTNAAGANMAFMASEENYQVLRSMHLKNLIIPVVGDFAGPKAIRAVGTYLKQHKATVTAFYLSNVEQYLFRQFVDAARFYTNVAELPVDSTSTFIRSVPPGGDAALRLATSLVGSVGVAGSTFYSVEVRDSAGVKIILTSRDSSGQRVTTRTIDSSGSPGRSPLEIFRSLRARDDSAMRARQDSAARASGIPVSPLIVFSRDSTMVGSMSRTVTMGPPLISGIANIRATLEAFDKGELGTYARAIAMTKTEGWK
jgi:hypothetical protein